MPAWDAQCGGSSSSAVAPSRAKVHHWRGHSKAPQPESQPVSSADHRVTSQVRQALGAILVMVRASCRPKDCQLSGPQEIHHANDHPSHEPNANARRRCLAPSMQANRAVPKEGVANPDGGTHSEGFRHPQSQGAAGERAKQAGCDNRPHVPILTRRVRGLFHSQNSYALAGTDLTIGGYDALAHSSFLS